MVSDVGLKLVICPAFQGAALNTKLLAPPSPVITTEFCPAMNVSLGVAAVSTWPAVLLAVKVTPAAVPLPVLEDVLEAEAPVIKSVLVLSEPGATLSMSTTVVDQMPFEPAPGGLYIRSVPLWPSETKVRAWSPNGLEPV